MLFIDKYAYNNRMIHVNPLVKLIIYILMLGISFSGILSIKLSFIGIVIPLTCIVARIRFRTYLKWILLTLPFVFLSLLTIMVTFSGSNYDMIWSQSIFNGYMGITLDSLRYTYELLTQVYCSLTSTYFFILTVPFQQLLQIFKKLKFPEELIEIMLLTYRFIFMFLHEFIVMRDTLDLKFAFGNWWRLHKSLGLLGGQFFTRLIKANEQLTQNLMLKFDE